MGEKGLLQKRLQALFIEKKVDEGKYRIAVTLEPSKINQMEKIVEEMRLESEKVPITDFIAVEINGELRRVHVPYAKNIHDFLEKWFGADKK